MKYLGPEFYKLKRKKIILMTFLFVAVEIMWCIVNSNRAITRNPDMLGGFEYSYMLMSFASLNGLFFPILISIITSRISDIEHKGDTWKLLKSSVTSLNSIYLSKFLCSAILVSIPVLMQVLSIVLFGHFRGVIESISVSLLLKYTLGTILVSIAIIALHLWIATVIPNQMIAITFGMIGSFIGLTSGLFYQGIRRLFIWSYYLELSPLSYAYDNVLGSSVYRIDMNFSITILVFLIGMLIYYIGRNHLLKKEV